VGTLAPPGEYGEFVLLSSHPSPQPNGKLIGSVGFAQLTAECHWRRLANTIEIVHNGTIMRIRLNLCLLRPTHVYHPKGKSIGSAVSVQLTADTLQRAPLSSKIAPSHGRISTTI